MKSASCKSALNSPMVVIKSDIGTQDNLAGRKSALNSTPLPSPVVYSTDLSKAVVPVLVLLFVAL